MKCSKCGNEIPSQSKFCLSCGQPVGPASAAPSAPVAGSKKTTTIMAIVAGLIIVAAIGLFARGRAVTQAPRPVNGNQSPVLKAPAAAGGPQADLLKTNVKNPPINLNAPAKTPAPADVVAYLAFLKQFDQSRVSLQEREKSALMSFKMKSEIKKAKALGEFAKNLEKDGPMPKDAGELPGASKLAPDFDKAWQDLAAQLISHKPVPDSCATLAGKYYEAVAQVRQSLAKLSQMMDSQDENISDMIGQSTPIDEKLEAADAELANVCTKYGITKDFSIRSDRSSGGSPLTGF